VSTAESTTESATSIASPRVATVALSLMTFVWGGTFIWTKRAIEAGERVFGPGHATTLIAWYVALRFTLAVPVLLVLSRSARGPFDRETVRGGVVLGIALAAGFFLQGLGAGEVSPAVSAFLTSLYVPITAALQLATGARRGLSRSLVMGALLATIGAAFVGGPPQISFGRGQFLTLACAVAFAIHIVLTDRVTRRIEPMPVTIVTFAVVAAIALVIAALPGARVPATQVVALLRDGGFSFALACATLLGTALALTLMNVYQRALDPVRSAIIYALEPVWATILAMSVGFGRGDRWLLFGGTALLAGNLVAEVGPRLGASRR
jgi:drug/metabolite transporter (DMT)-like permease